MDILLIYICIISVFSIYFYIINIYQSMYILYIYIYYQDPNEANALADDR